jgi:nicotinamide-nucleotide amidase
VIGEVRRAAIVAIGDELLAGAFVDSNSGEIARALDALGIEVERFVVLGDDRARLAQAFWELARDYAIVVASGGLGPTLDDVSREAAADAARVPLETSDEVLAGLRAAWERRGLPMPESNARQALFPAGAQIMPNSCGTAPGFRVWIDGGMLALLPGPPREMRAMLAQELLPWLERTCGRGAARALGQFHLAGLSESAFADRAGDWMARDADPRMGVTAHEGLLRVSLRAVAETSQAARERLESRMREFRERFEGDVYSEDDPRLGHALGRTLIERGLSVTTAESCTGGLVAELLTDVPGISAVFRDGWVTYGDDSKRARLGVDAALLERHGAVSGEVAQAMAEGAARASGARLAVSTTGIAGPDGGTPQTPVGLVWFGLCVDGQSEAVSARFPAVGREAVRAFAAHRALDLLRRRLPGA